MKSTITSSATARLKALNALGILDTPPEPAFDGLVAMARTICRTPTALISLVDADRQWFKARVGFEPSETGLEKSVCIHALAQDATLIVADLSLDPRTKDNPLVTGAPGIRFYAGAVLRTSTGQGIGSLCVIDTVPRPGGLSAEQRALLEALATQAMALIEMRVHMIKRESDSAEDRESAERSRLAAEAGRVGTFDIDVATNVISVSPEMCRVFGMEIRPSYDATEFEELLLPEDRGMQSSSTDRGAGTSAQVVEYRIRRAGDAAVRWIARHGDFVRAPNGTVTRFTGTVSDITDRKLAELRQQVLIDLAEVIFGADTIAEIVTEACRLLGTNLGVQRVGYASIDLTAELFTVEGDWHAEGAASLAGTHGLAAFQMTAHELRRGRPFIRSDIGTGSLSAPDEASYAAIGVGATIVIPLRRRGQLVGCLFAQSARPRTWIDEERLFLEAVAERVDVGIARVRAEDAQRLLNDELGHRLKNTLAMVSALAKQTLRGVTEREAVEAFHARIAALATAHDVLLRTSWTSARIRAVVESGMAIHTEPARYLARGPDVRLGPKSALSIAMLLHELATNANKYGALSAEGGMVEIDWEIVRDMGEAELRLRWRELGGPRVDEPVRKGFGSRLIATGISGTGRAELSYLSEGLRATFHASMRLVTQS